MGDAIFIVGIIFLTYRLTLDERLTGKGLRDITITYLTPSPLPWPWGHQLSQRDFDWGTKTKA